MSFNHKEIEQKWQQFWREHDTFKTGEDMSKPKFYALDMFPYPSGVGLHVGHPEGYTATDIMSRMKRAQGYNVLHPMGWDAFGLPAEQYALDTGNDPAEFTEKNIQTFKRQIQSLGFSYDWNREVNTTDPDYYKWTQWIFMQLYNAGLAEMKEIPVNWCEELGTVLANEEIVNGVSERGGYPVVRKPMRQWVLKITKYAERLLEDLDDLDWPEHLKDMQRNWIGKSEGADVRFAVDGFDDVVEVYTTRPDTLFGVTYVVLAPEHELVDKITTAEHRHAVDAYKIEVAKKSEFERTELQKVKTGVPTGAFAIHPLTGEKLPIWIADYVLASYGSGAVMAVPGHDGRDFEFAKVYNLPIAQVIEGDLSEEAILGDGVHINSEFLNGLDNAAAKEAMIEYLEAHDCGTRKVNYKLRDWLFSRQRYWGEPFPVIHWEDGTMSLVNEDELPVLLPKMKHIQPSGTGESPLANAADWLIVDGAAYGRPGQKGRRETNTMPQWAGSCWYFLRYIDPHNTEEFVSREKLEYWLPVDLYIGGAEHAVLHLLYARFWHKVLFDLGLVPTSEPFQRLFNQGMILGANNEKMSKSLGNVVNPDKIVESHGADTLRLYEMFMGPLDAAIAWSEEGLDGSRRFLERVWRLYTEVAEITENNDGALEQVYHQTVKKVTADFESLNFNTAISQMMIFVNEVYKHPQLPVEYAKGFIQLLAPIAPHICEEIWQTVCGESESISYAAWPTYDEAKTKSSEIQMVVQVNGKVRAKINVAADISKEAMEALALEQENVQAFIEGQTVRKVIVVPGKLVNIVVG